MSEFAHAEEFRELLAQRGTKLSAEIKAKLAEAKDARVAPDAVTVSDGGDKAALDLTAHLDLAEASRDIEELRQIEAAQARIADGSFGICVDCGKAIALERLRVNPTATRCIPCQTEYERRQGGVHGSRL